MAKTKNSFEERRRVYYEIISPIAEIFYARSKLSGSVSIQDIKNEMEKGRN